MNNTEIVLMIVDQFNPETCMEEFGEEIIDKLQGQLDDFTCLFNSDSEVICMNKPKFNKAVKDALMPIIKEHLSFHMDQVGNHLNLTYDVKTRKYIYEGKEFDELPEVFEKV